MLHFLFLYQADGVGRDAFLAASEAEFLGGRGLDGNIVLVADADLSHTRLHGRDVGIHLGALGTDGAVDFILISEYAKKCVIESVCV